MLYFNHLQETNWFRIISHFSPSSPVDRDSHESEKGARFDLFKPGLFVFKAEPPGAVAGIDRAAQRESLFDKVDFEKDAAAAASVPGSQYIS